MNTHLDTLKQEMLNTQQAYEHDMYRKLCVQLVIDEYNKKGKDFYETLKSFIEITNNSNYLNQMSLYHEVIKLINT